ncbi:hypothetical protein H0O02_04230 [Candidatus Micrarchaeota archaeon]|nr:hypothetical protein [Candidatus Micrarchaeota archaeon]
MVGLITVEDEKRLLDKMIAYYRNIYPGMDFRKEEKTLTHKEMGELYYTYPGEEGEVTAEEKMLMISDAVGHGYSTPILILKRAGKLILLDGHRRVRVAFSQGLSWKAYVIIPGKEDVEFGIESTIMGKVKDLF